MNQKQSVASLIQKLDVCLLWLIWTGSFNSIQSFQHNLCCSIDED